MNNFLGNGTVMPHGLLSCDPSDFLRGHAKSYNNTALRFGVIKQIYPITDSKNVSKLSTEYDVDIIEQDMNRGVAPITYKNCLSVDSLGGMADYFEKNFRAQTQSKNFQLPLTKGQNGATVLVLCLDATTGKGVILGGLSHPDRPTTLIDDQPRLSGEYNGVAVAINPDGSTSLTFNGATDNSGTVINPSQGPTTFEVKKDGSFEFNHSAITISADKSGLLTITATGNVNLTCATANVIASGDANVTAIGKTTIKAKEIDLNISSPTSDNGILTSNSSYGVVDMITGLPLQPSTTTFGDV